MSVKKKISIKRIYEEPAKGDGIRILVDRLWPRGVSKVKAKLDYWFKELAPSTELRKWFAHDPDKYKEFAARYKKELKRKEAQELIRQVRSLAKTKKITLVFAAKDADISNASVLQKIL